MKSNLKCKHCYQGSHMDEQLMMNLNEVRSIASKLGELGTLSVVLTGGEPFLHPNLVEIVETFNNWNIRVVIFTNGQVIQNETIRKLSNMNVLVRISLEGHNEEINDFIRGVGTFKKAIEFSNICRENNLSIGYSFTINSINEKYFSDMLQLAEDSFADEIEMSEILNVNQNLNISSLMLSEKQSKNFRINTLKGFSISKAFRKGMGLYRYKKGTEYICSAGTKNIFIDINGDVYPCNLFANHNEYFAGNVFSEDLLEIWRKSKVFIELRNLKKEDIEECANCPASENCKGGGPNGDSGLTGRKIIVDTYGGYARHGGGAFSGKDCTKVDRSAAYAARYIAKNIVAAGLAEKCEIQLSYAIGVARPMSIMVDTFGTSKLSDSVLSEIICRHFDLRPTGIIKMLNLRQPIYKQTSAYGHFGRDDLDLSWEKTDKIEVLKEDYNSIISKKSK